MSRALTALLIINLSVGVIAVMLSTRASVLASDASLHVAEAKAQVELLDSRSAKCAEASASNTVLLHQLLGKP